MMPTPHLRVEKKEKARIVRFAERMLWDDRVVREVSEGLQELVRQMPRGHALVLDFAEVSLASSSMLGTLLMIQRRLYALGGKLRLCELNEGLRSVLRTTNLDRILTIDRDRRESLEALFGTETR